MDPHDTPGSGTSLPLVRGFLFDIDDTLVDLHAAMKEAMIVASAPLLPHCTAEGWSEFARLYMEDPHRYYDRYVAGEFTFAQQRGLRARFVLDRFGYVGFDDAAEQKWIADFEAAQPRAIRPFLDVIPVLDALDAAGIPYGAVSNNVHDYQRAKLDQAGLTRIEVLVGIDAFNAAKPDPRLYREGCRLIGTAPSATLYVGDNYAFDGVGAVDAGLQGIWLNRAADGPTPSGDKYGVRVVSDLSQLASLIPLAGLPTSECCTA